MDDDGGGGGDDDNDDNDDNNIRLDNKLINEILMNMKRNFIHITC